jgi:4'-phosphopantetheinyl transferase
MRGLSLGTSRSRDPLAPPEVPPLRDGEVHVWRAALADRSLDLPELCDLLSPEERARAARFRFPRDRARFIAARACLRRLLARYTGERPERLRLAAGPFGKPRLDSQPAARRVEFNLSHSGAIALYAFAQGRRVGIDVERVLSIAEDDERLSDLWLSEAELAELAALDAVARTRSFHSLWTRKEAYLKARGEGLSLAPDRVRIWEERVLSEPREGVQWFVQELPIGPQYAAALAVEGECDAVTIRRWIGPPFAFPDPT